MSKGVSISVIGLGQGGCRIAKAFYDGGHNLSLFINSASVDLESLDVPDELKILIGDGDGAGKDMVLAQEFLMSSIDEVMERCQDLLKADKVLVCASSGGGTGSGTIAALCKAIRDKISEQGLKTKLCAIVSCPGSSELVSGKVKSNARSCLDSMCELVEEGTLRPLMIVDNDLARKHARIKSLRTFFEDTNRYIFNIIDHFNKRCVTPTMFVSLDKNDLRGVFDKPGTLFIGSKTITHPNDEIMIRRQLDHAIRSGCMMHGDGGPVGEDCAITINVPSEMLDGDPGFFERFSSIVNKHIDSIEGSYFHRGIYEDEKITSPRIFLMSTRSSSPRKAVESKLK
jgi:cell division GTPase FtsZ